MTDMSVPPQGPIGQSIKRKEDLRFLTGAGQYTDDVNQPNQVHAVFLRSPHAHATIRSIDTTKAKAAPGVVAVYTGADLEGVNGLPCGVNSTTVSATPRVARTCSTARSSGSGFITIPGPPPYGTSSTLRCRSVVKSRRS